MRQTQCTLLVSLIVLYTLLRSPTVVKAVPLSQFNDPSLQCGVGAMMFLQGQVAEAWPMLEEGYAGLQANPNASPDLLAMCGLYVGALRQSIGDYNGALETYTVALEKFQETDDVQMIWTMQYGIGSVYMAQGRYAEAQQQFETALPLTHSSKPWVPANIKSLAEAVTLNNLGVVKGSLEDYQGARADLLASLEIMQMLAAQAQAVPQSSGTLPDSSADPLGDLLEMLDALPDGGEPAQPDEQMESLEFLKQLLDGMNESGGNNQESADGTGLDFLGLLLGGATDGGGLGLEGLFQMGMLSDFVNSTAKNFEPIVLNNIGETYRREGQQPEALNYFQQALTAIDALEPKDGLALSVEAITYNNIGLSYYEQDDFQTALTNFEAAEQQLRQLNHRPGLASLLVNTAEIKQIQGDNGAALADYEEALAIVETIRGIADSRLTNIVAEGGLSTSNAYALSGSTGEFRDIYDEAVALYHQTGQDEAAFNTAEQGRARVFLNLLLSGQLELADPAAAALLAEERRAYARRQAAEDAFVQAQVISQTNPALVTTSAEALTQAEADYQDVLTQINAQDNELAQLISGQEGVLTLPEIQALLDPETTLLYYYVLGDEGSLAFVLTQDDLTVVELPEATPASSYQEINLLRDWADLETDHPQPAQNLYSWLVAPVEEYLSTPSVGIVPHQLLHYVPFAALTDGEDYLSQDHQLFVLPSASILPTVRENAQKTPLSTATPALVFGNPAINAQLPVLINTSAEADQIGTLFNVPAYTRQEASESRLRTNSAQARVIHLAAHGVYSATQPLDSAIYLALDSQADGQLQVREIYNLGLTSNEMVVLSACDTTIGELSKGDELVGLTRAFFVAGSPTVIASLWPVDDEITSGLMVAFYRYWQEGMSKAAALQAAQADIRSQAGFESPYYWAAFVLNGNPE